MFPSPLALHWCSYQSSVLSPQAFHFVYGSVELIEDAPVHQPYVKFINLLRKQKHQECDHPCNDPCHKRNISHKGYTRKFIHYFLCELFLMRPRGKKHAHHDQEINGIGETDHLSIFQQNSVQPLLK